LNVAKPALIAVDEILRAERNIHLPQIAAPTQLVGYIGRNVLRPFLDGVEADDANEGVQLDLRITKIHATEQDSKL
jgi:hypothetical protein